MPVWWWIATKCTVHKWTEKYIRREHQNGEREQQKGSRSKRTFAVIWWWKAQIPFRRFFAYFSFLLEAKTFSRRRRRFWFPCSSRRKRKKWKVEKLKNFWIIDFKCRTFICTETNGIIKRLRPLFHSPFVPWNLIIINNHKIFSQNIWAERLWDYTPKITVLCTDVSVGFSFIFKVDVGLILLFSWRCFHVSHKYKKITEIIWPKWLN